MTIDPRKHYCQCGCTFTPGMYHKLVMLLLGKYYWRCPRCQTRITFQYIGHVAKIETEENKNKSKVWKNG